MMYSFVEFTKFLDDLLVKNNVECSPPRTAARMLDKVRRVRVWASGKM
jgi:hypothetical protein